MSWGKGFKAGISVAYEASGRASWFPILTIKALYQLLAMAYAQGSSLPESTRPKAQLQKIRDLQYVLFGPINAPGEYGDPSPPTLARWLLDTYDGDFTDWDFGGASGSIVPTGPASGVSNKYSLLILSDGWAEQVGDALQAYSQAASDSMRESLASWWGKLTDAAGQAATSTSGASTSKAVELYTGAKETAVKKGEGMPAGPKWLLWALGAGLGAYLLMGKDR